ncbi:MAG: hypothetical protein ACOH2J_17215 [Allorhizobium sp.]
MPAALPSVASVGFVAPLDFLSLVVLGLIDGALGCILVLATQVSRRHLCEDID